MGSIAMLAQDAWAATPLWVAAVVGAFALGTGLYAIERFFVAVPYPSNIDLVGERPGARRFSLRTRLRYYTDCADLYREAWEEYLKKGKPVVVPGLGVRKEVILPPAYMRWAVSMSDDKLNTPEAMADADQARWTLGHDGPIIDSWQGMLVKSDLNRVLEGICAALSDELELAFDAHFGAETETWRDIELRSVVNRAIAQANSRFTVGLPLCRNQDYLKTVLDLNDGLLTLGGITSGSPVVLRPILGTVLGIPMTLRINRIKQWLVPLWKERLRLQDEADAGRLASTKLPVDHVQMMTRYARRERPHEVDDYELIARRICAQSFGAVHQTSLQVCNLLLDILGSDSQHDTIARLCAEADAILSDSDLAPATEPIGKDVQEGEEEEEKKTPNGADPEKEKLKDKDAPTTARWTKARVSRMVLADSASRETLRLHSFANRACMRKCMVDGLQTPGGHNIPRGSVVSFLTHPVQTDADYYKDPLAYDPFRFARSRKENGGSGSSTPTTATSSSSTPMTFVSTGPEFLPFGHGRHACPGRFIVDFELKMITSHILRNYDIKFPDEYQGRRPPNVWIAEATFPPPGARILVKRKKKADAKV